MIIPMTVSVLLRIIFVLLILLGINIIYLAYKKKEDRKGQEIKEAYIREKQLKWFSYFRDSTPSSTELIPKNLHEIEGVEEIFLVYLQNLKTPVIIDKISQFSNEYLSEHFKSELQSRRWSKRINAMQRIVDFQIDRLVDDCVHMDPEKLSSEEQFYRLKIIANLRKNDFIEQLQASNHVFSEYEYKRILMDLDEDILNRLLVNLDSYPTICQYSIIDVVGMNRNLDFLPFLHELTRSSDAERRIRSLKAIYEIGVVSDIGKYSSFSDSPIWEERLMFTKLLLYFPSQVAYPFLQQLIKDEAWAVRLEAGSVMRKYKDGTKMLRAIIDNEKDPFAIDMAAALLKEGDEQ